MKFYLKNHSRKIVATGDYDEKTNHMTVLKGSFIRPISLSTNENVKRQRIYKEHVVDGVLKQNIESKSPSTAAAFVTGTSINGQLRWKTEDGKTLRFVKENKND